MTTLFIETRGHTASKTLSKIFDNCYNSYVAWGTQNFVTRDYTAWGKRLKQSPEEYIDAMIEKRKSYQTVVSIHANLGLRAKDLCKEKNINYFYMIRNPIDQIDSCYKHRLNSYLKSPDPTFGPSVDVIFDILIKLDIPPTFANTIFTLATHYIISGNIPALRTGSPIVKMEKILNSKTDFINGFGLEDKNREHMPFFDDRKFFTHQHSKLAEKLGLFSADKRRILERYKVQFNNLPSCNFVEYIELCGYSVDENLSSERLKEVN